MSLRDQFKKVAEHAKNAGSFLLKEFQETLIARNAAAEKALMEQINQIASLTVPLKAYRRTLDAKSPALQSHALVVNSALTMFANEGTTLHVRKFITGTQHKLLEESKLPDGRRKLAFWNEKTNKRDVYEEIFTEKSTDGSGQFTSYYNTSTGAISINLSGTVVTDIDDLKSAAQAAIEATASMRMAHVKGCVDQMVANFNKFYPGKLAKMPIDVYAHSAGGGSVALTNYFLQRGHNLVPRAQVMFDPFGSKNSFEKLSKVIAQIEGRDPDQVLDILTRNTITYKPKHFTLIDAFKKLRDLNPLLGNAPATIGHVQTVDVQGNSLTVHQIRSWIRFFNNAEILEVAANGNSPFKKFVRKP